MVKAKRILGIMLILVLGLTMVPGSLALAGDAPAIEWTDQFGSTDDDSAYGVYAYSSGVYVVGDTWDALPEQTSAGDEDAFIRKYDADGNALWTDQFGTADWDCAYGVYADSSGVYVVGDTYGDLGDTNAGGNDVFIRKYDADGTEQWTRQFGTADYDGVNGVYGDSGGVYVAGCTYGDLGDTNAGGCDAFIRKYDADGNALWTVQFGTSSSDCAHGVYADSNGVYVAGNTDGSFSGYTQAGDGDAFVSKFDTSGTEQWTSQFGSSESDVAEGAYADSSGVYAMGSASGALSGQTSAGSRDAFIRKYDASGTELWTRQFGTAAYDEAYGIYGDSGGVYVAGYTGGTLPEQTSAGGYDAFIRNYDASGNESWTRQFGTDADDEAYGVSGGSSGVYVVGDTEGSFSGYSNAGFEDVFVVKFPPTTSPTMQTWNPQGVTGSSAKLRGYLDDLGTASSVDCYFEWGETDSYGNTTTVQAKTATGVFKFNLTGLTPGTEYHYRSVGAGDGTAYGPDKSFTTSATAPPTMQTWAAQSVTGNSARLRGHLADLGTAASVDCSFEWGETTSYGNTTTAQAKSSTGVFKQNISGLAPGTEYHYRSVGAGDGTGYGPDKTFTTSATVPPTLQTWAAQSVTGNSARLRGKLADLGTAASVDCSFEWGETTSYGNTTTAQSKSSTGVFKQNISGLAPGTTYHYRSVGAGDGTGYGPDKTFTTAATVPPTMQTWAAQSVTGNSARLRGNLNDLGTAASVDCYFEWGETDSYGNTTTTQSKSSTGVFKFNLTVLKPGTTYHYRAVGIGDGTAYGPDRSFTTPS